MNNIKIIIITASTTFLVMLAYETGKELLLKGVLSSWQSHWLTISFTTFLAILVTLSLINKIEKIRKRSLSIQLKEEKLKSIRQVLHIAHHHVNNLAQSLQIIEYELQSSGKIEEKTLTGLKKAIQLSSKELRKIDDIDDPFNDNFFKINF